MMTEPAWITADDCLSFHDKLLARFGGAGGVRDMGLLDSALTRPRHLFAHGAPTRFDMAAAYADGIVHNHPFIDGNKRSGLLAAALFLEANGVPFVATEEEAAAQTLALAAGAITAEVFAAWLARSCGGRATG
jgi:death-on-curing protein